MENEFNEVDNENQIPSITREEAEKLLAKGRYKFVPTADGGLIVAMTKKSSIKLKPQNKSKAKKKRRKSNQSRKQNR